MKKFIWVLKEWFPLAFAITVVCAFAYASAQQVYRQSANDPQIQMAEDAAAALTGGSQLQSLILAGTVNIDESLSPYLVFYNEAGVPAGGSGLLHGKFPTLPQGVFDYTRTAGEDKVTWQPEAGIRQAIAVVHVGGAQGGFVMAGRSLREVEKREWQLEISARIAWITALIGTFLLKALAMTLNKNPRS